jgi:hypothetical protein
VDEEVISSKRYDAETVIKMISTFLSNLVDDSDEWTFFLDNYKPEHNCENMFVHPEGEGFVDESDFLKAISIESVGALFMQHRQENGSYLSPEWLTLSDMQERLEEIILYTFTMHLEQIKNDFSNNVLTATFAIYILNKMDSEKNLLEHNGILFH